MISSKLLIAILVIFSFLLPGLVPISVSSSYAATGATSSSSTTGYDLNGEASCWAMNGIWFAPDNCKIYGLDNVAGATFTIESGITLSFNENSNNQGTLVIKGTLNMVGDSELVNNGTIANYGTILNDGILKNLQTINNSGGIFNPGDLINHGTIFNTVGLLGDECSGSISGHSIVGNNAQSMVCAPEFFSWDFWYPFNSGTRTVTMSGTDNTELPLTITLYSGSTVIGSASDTNGSWSITAEYATGSYDLHAAATNSSGSISPPSAPFDLNVRPATNTEVSCNPSTVPHDSSTICTATVTDLGGGNTTNPSGRVNFKVEPPNEHIKEFIGKCTLKASSPGQSSCTVTYTP